MCTGGGVTNAATSVTALALDSRFDLSKAYWIVAGIAGVDPQDASLGSAAWAKWLVDAASRRQKWIDQAQSLNLYIAGASGKKLDITYRMAWLRGLKTTYYLRALGATSTEKSTLDRGTLNAVSSEHQEPGITASQVTPAVNDRQEPLDLDIKDAAPVPMACSIDDPDCEACQ